MILLIIWILSGYINLASSITAIFTAFAFAIITPMMSQSHCTNGDVSKLCFL